MVLPRITRQPRTALRAIAPRLSLTPSTASTIRSCIMIRRDLHPTPLCPSESTSRQSPVRHAGTSGRAIVEPGARRLPSAPTFRRSAISLMKVILVARNALAAYLINSAVRRIGKSAARLSDSGGRYLALRARSSSADDDTVRKLESDRSAFPQEFRVGFDHHVGKRAGFAVKRSTSSPGRPAPSI